MIGTADIREALMTHVAEGIEVEVTEPDGRVACLTPLDYPSGDGVVVWVSSRNGGFEITDYGEAYTSLLSHPAQDYKALLELAADICRGFDVDLGEGRVMASPQSESALGDAVWRVAAASAQIAQASGYYRPRRRAKPEREFVRAVDDELRERKVEVNREHELIGSSGHTHRATFYLPSRETVLEPLLGAGYWSQVSSVYAKFGDLSRTNGYRLFSLIDDRDQALPDDFVGMLTQVSELVDWSRRGDWLSGVS